MSIVNEPLNSIEKSSIETVPLSTDRSLSHNLQFLNQSRIVAGVLVLAELFAIVIWSFYVGRNLLDPNPEVWPLGGDFHIHASLSYIWSWFKMCGACIMWNGTSNGGAPAFAEQLGGVLHPLTPITVLIWGPLYGVKINIILTLAMAGIAQWWLARVMSLGFIARMWVAAMAVVGGHLAATVASGWPILTLSVAASSLILAPGIELALTGKRRAAILFGVTGALAFLSGHGYLQFGLLLSVLPVFLIFLWRDGWQFRPVWREFLLAGIIAVLIAAVYWLPMFHFWPNVGKPGNPDFSATQALEYQPLNLVIRDAAFYGTTVLNQKAIPGYHAYFIGWIPVLLAIATLILVPNSQRRLLMFFILSIILVYLASSAVSLQWVARFVPFVNGMRHPMVIATLAVPLILGLAAWAVDIILRLGWARIKLSLSSMTILNFSLAWLVLALPLIFGLKTAYDFNRRWLVTQPQPAAYLRVMDSIKLDSTQLVKPPYGEMIWFLTGLEDDWTRKFVLSPEHRSWSWKGRQLPPGYMMITRDPAVIQQGQVVGVVDGNTLVVDQKAEYAFVDTGSQRIPCRAKAIGGNIDVDCDTASQGILTIYENSWTGWSATQDGALVTLGSGPWLTVPAPAGNHHYEFRYRPWDVPVGLLFTVSGLILAFALWWTKSRTDHNWDDARV